MKVGTTAANVQLSWTLTFFINDIYWSFVSGKNHCELAGVQLINKVCHGHRL